jgi:hypothetical protein
VTLRAALAQTLAALAAPRHGGSLARTRRKGWGIWGDLGAGRGFGRDGCRGMKGK